LGAGDRHQPGRRDLAVIFAAVQGALHAPLAGSVRDRTILAAMQAAPHAPLAGSVHLRVVLAAV
jgi:hypothetical protein